MAQSLCRSLFIVSVRRKECHRLVTSSIKYCFSSNQLPTAPQPSEIARAEAFLSNLKHIIKPKVVESEPPVEEDVLLKEIRNISTAEEALKFYENQRTLFETHHMVALLMQLMYEHKKHNSDLDVVNTQTFNRMSRHLMKHLHHLFEADVVKIFQVLTYFKIPISSYLGQHLWKLLCDDVNLWTVKRSLFVYKLIQKHAPDKRLEALKQGIVLSMGLNFDKRLNHNDAKELGEALRFCTKNQMKLQVSKIITIISAQDEEWWTNLSASDAYQIALGILKSGRFTYEHFQIFKRTTEIIMTNIEEFTFLESWLLLVNSTARMKNFSELYDELLIDVLIKACAPLCGDISKCLNVITNTTNLRYMSSTMNNRLLQLVDLKGNIFFQQPELLFKFVNQLSEISFDNSGQLKWMEEILTITYLPSDTSPKLAIAYDLINLGIFNQRILDEVFSSDFLKEIEKLDNQEKSLALEKMLTINEACNECWQIPSEDKSKWVYGMLQSHEFYPSLLSNALDCICDGPQFHLDFCCTESGIPVDHVVAVEKADPLTFISLFPETSSQQERRLITDIKLPKSQLCLIVNLPQEQYFRNQQHKFSALRNLQIKQLEKAGWRVLTFWYPIWVELPSEEKYEYLKRCIVEKFED